MKIFKSTKGFFKALCYVHYNDTSLAGNKLFAGLLHILKQVMTDEEYNNFYNELVSNNQPSIKLN